MLDPWFKRRYPMKHLKKWLYWPWAEYKVLRDATAVLFTCEEERRLARQSFWLYKCDEFVVNYGTSAPTGDPETQRALFLERYPHLRAKRCLLFLGRVHEKKGPDLLFHAFAALLARLPADRRGDLHLVMAGPDDHAFGQKMKALVASLGLAKNVTWTGMVSGDLKWGAFHASDAFVLTSHQENFGIAVVEALACGVPVLISNQVNIWREIQQAGAGFVDSDDPAGAGRLLEQWADVDRALWERMRGAAKKVFSERFVIDRTAESFIRAMRLYGLRSSPA
jgi:glycosyltransferase involved in cell wall biosynthesis